MNLRSRTLRLVALGLIAGLSTVAIAQQVGGTLQGTIRVADDAEDPSLARVTPEQARDAALAAAPGTTFLDADLDEEDGFLVYDVDLRTDAEEVDVLVDAGSGAVLLVEREPLDND